MKKGSLILDGMCVHRDVQKAGRRKLLQIFSIWQQEGDTLVKRPVCTRAASLEAIIGGI